MTAEPNGYYTMQTFPAPALSPAPARRPASMLSGIHDAVLIYNPTAGSRRSARRKRLAAAQKILATHKIETELKPTSGPGDATLLARMAVEQRRHLVILSGGDGTLNEAVNGLAGSQVPLALLPSGTANVLGKELSLPWDIPRAAELIAGSTLRRIAIGQVISPNSPLRPRYFICVGGAGPDGAMIHKVGVEAKRRLGILAYWLEGARMAFTYRYPAYRVVTPELSLEAIVLIVGRTKHYGGPVRITTRASILDNQFEVMASLPRSRWRQMLELSAVFGGRLRKVRGVYFWKTSSVRVEPLSDSEPIYAQVDGEEFGSLPVEFRIVPDALTLAIPPSARL